MEKRLLNVYDVWKITSLIHQVMTTMKSKQVGMERYTIEHEADEATEIHGIEKYLSTLHTYLLALSIADSNKAQGAPVDETLGSDSTKYAKVPWDVLQAYHFRTSRSAMLIPEASRLAWLESDIAKDIAERANWVSQFREGDESLGQVGHAIMEKRDALWEALQSATGSPTFPPQPPLVRDPKKPWQQQQQQQKPRQTNSPGAAVPQTNPRKMVPGTTSEALRDGKKLCPDFNKGKCQTKGPSCSRGLHKCAKVLKGGRPCGMNFHGAHNCRNP